MNRLVALALGCWFLALGSSAAQTPKKDEVPKFIKNLGATDAKSRLEAAQGIGKIGQLKAVYAKDGIGPLCDTVLKDEDAKVRIAAANSLGMILLEPTKVVPVLAKVAKDDKDWPVQSAAITSLGYFGADAKDAVEAINEVRAKVKKELEDAGDDKAKVKAAKAKDKIINGALRSIMGK